MLLKMVSVTRLQLLRLEKQQARTSPECEAATLLVAEGLQHHCQDLEEQMTKLWEHQHLCQVEFNYNNEGSHTVETEILHHNSLSLQNKVFKMQLLNKLKT